MAEIHILTDKEEKAIGNAISVIKKFGNYIRNVNLTNECLRRNLDESIKSGDVTNEQKCNLRIYERSVEMWNTLHQNLKRKCKTGCKCSEFEQENCICFEAFRISDLLYRVVHGEDIAWEEVFWRLSQTTRKDYLNAIRNGKTSHCCREGENIKLEGYKKNGCHIL